MVSRELYLKSHDKSRSILTKIIAVWNNSVSWQRTIVLYSSYNLHCPLELFIKLKILTEQVIRMCSSILSEQLFIWIKNINYLKIGLTGTSRVTLTTLWSQAMSLSSAPFELICKKTRWVLNWTSIEKTELLNYNPRIHHLKIEEKRTWIVRSGA